MCKVPPHLPYLPSRDRLFLRKPIAPLIGRYEYRPFSHRLHTAAKRWTLEKNTEKTNPTTISSPLLPTTSSIANTNLATLFRNTSLNRDFRLCLLFRRCEYSFLSCSWSHSRRQRPSLASPWIRHHRRWPCCHAWATKGKKKAEPRKKQIYTYPSPTFPHIARTHMPLATPPHLNHIPSQQTFRLQDLNLSPKLGS